MHEHEHLGTCTLYWNARYERYRAKNGCNGLIPFTYLILINNNAHSNTTCICANVRVLVGLCLIVRAQARSFVLVRSSSRFSARTHSFVLVCAHSCSHFCARTYSFVLKRARSCLCSWIRSCSYSHVRLCLFALSFVLAHK